MDDESRRFTQNHDELNAAFDRGSIFEASPEDLRRYVQTLGQINIKSDEVRIKAVIRTLVCNHLQMEHALKEMHQSNGLTQRLVVALTIAALFVGGLQALLAIVQICMAG